MPFPGGRHGPGHYIPAGGGGAGGDPVGTVLVLQSEGFPGPAGIQQVYTTVNGSAFSLIGSSPDNPGRGELLSSDILLMAAVSDNDPPTAAQEINFVSGDAASWTDEAADAGSPWNIDTSPSFSGSAFFEVAGLFVLFKNLVATGNYFTSPDGIVWTQRTGPWGSASIGQNHYMSDGSFDYVLGGGGLFRSTDGITWTTVEASVTAQQACVFAASNAGDNYWLFGNSGASSRVESSADGSVSSFARDNTAETNLDGAGLISFANSFGVAYANSIGAPGTFVLSFNAGVGVGSSLTRLATSTDGVVWANPGLTFNGNFVRFSGTLGEFVRTAGDATRGTLLRSGNGTFWTQNDYAAFGTFTAHPTADLLIMFR